VQLAWDFTTGTRERVEADMLRVRELTRAWLEANAPTIHVDSVEPGTDRVWRTIRGTVSGPLFLENTKPGASLVRNKGGSVIQNGTATFAFTATVPASVRDRFAAGRVLAYGHGFFGGRQEVEDASAHTIADRLAAVLVAIDWLGMSKADVSVVANALSAEPSHVAVFTDRVHQAMANWIVMTRSIRTSLVNADGFRRPTAPGEPGVVVDAQGNSNVGQPIYDASAVSYFGASQGHILGGVMNALNPDTARVCLNVGGAGLTHMMFRARPFAPFLVFLGFALPDPLDQMAFAATLQTPFDRIDPGVYAGHLLANPLEGSPSDRRVLMQIGLGDAQVPNLASFLHARLLQLPELTPNPAPVWGLKPTAAPVMGSALTLFDFGVDLGIYRTAIPPLDDNPVHEGLRLLDSALSQMDAFYGDGTIVQPCNGPCAPN
jgi:hypothetical protein